MLRRNNKISNSLKNINTINNYDTSKQNFK